MREPTFKVTHIRWWQKPIPLVVNRDGGHDQVGWVWNQWAYVVKNISAGWIAFADQQTPENIELWRCDHCGASTSLTRRWAIEKSLAKKDTTDAS